MCSDLSPWWQNQLVLVGHDGVAVLDNYPLNIALWIGQTLQSRSLRGCNSNKASLITKWQYCGEIRNLRNTNPGVLLLSSRALVIAINWDGPPSPAFPRPQSPDLGKKSELTQTWLDSCLSCTVVVFSWQDSSYNCWLFILIALSRVPTYSGSKLSTSN